MDERGTRTGGPRNKKVDDNSLSFTRKRWLRQSVKKRKKSFTHNENCVDATIQGYKEYTKMDKETNYSHQQQQYQQKEFKDK